MPFSEGCNKMIRNNTAALITSANDFLENMGWQTLKQQPEAVERQLFPDLTPQEQQVVSLLQQTNDLQLNILSVKTNIPIGTPFSIGNERRRKAFSRRNLPPAGVVVLHQSFFVIAVVRAIGNDDVVEKADIHQFAGLYKTGCKVVIHLAGMQIA